MKTQIDALYSIYSPIQPYTAANGLHKGLNYVHK